LGFEEKQESVDEKASSLAMGPPDQRVRFDGPLDTAFGLGKHLENQKGA